MGPRSFTTFIIHYLVSRYQRPTRVWQRFEMLSVGMHFKFHCAAYVLIGLMANMRKRNIARGRGHLRPNAMINQALAQTR